MLSFIFTIWITGVILLSLLTANTVANNDGWKSLALNLGVEEDTLKKFIVVFILGWPVMVPIGMF